jgi:RND family efflux transporter MFP subunit
MDRQRSGQDQGIWVGLGETGYTAGKAETIEYRWAQDTDSGIVEPHMIWSVRDTRVFASAMALTVVLWLGSTHSTSSQDRSEGISGAQSFKGIVAPARSYEIAPAFDGQVKKIHFVAGRYVEKGALLFELDTTKEELELERDRARLLRAEAQLRIAELVLRNNTELRKKNIVSERQFAESEAQRDIAAAAVTEARVQVREDELKIGQMKGYAPFAGIMSRPKVAEGSYLVKVKQTGLAMLTELDPIQVSAKVPYDLYADHLKLLKFDGRFLDPKEAMVRIDVFVTLPNGIKLPQVGKISGGGYEFDPDTQVMEVTVDFPNPGLLLRPGLAVTLQARVKSD